MTNYAPRPLFRDPIYDGAADPTLIWNPHENAWWMVYTARRANLALADDVAWIHGTALGIASTVDGGESWLYRGTLNGLDTEPGTHTYWAPEIIQHGETFHMFVSVIDGIPSTWIGHARTIRHYVSENLWDWSFVQTLELSSNLVIDACVFPLAHGGWRLWYKDEADDCHTWSTDSSDLYSWDRPRQAVTETPHEGPNVFALQGAYWMVVDEWRGLAVYRSADLDTWQRQGMILEAPGTGPDDGAIGQHPDVVVRDDDALIFYFTHPDGGRRTTLHVARLQVVDGTLVCDRDSAVPTPSLPVDGPKGSGYSLVERSIRGSSLNV
ncbi:family 43 glycosylhydrolase [Microbacterium sp. 22215]|uniref:family 43 glycosylhydrolase n=1 Tax=Microbacterium sp. 22215 TaxID=3453893 RepID=UPI003F864DFD